MVAVLRPHSSYFLSSRIAKKLFTFVLPQSLWLVIISLFLHHVPLPVRIAVLPNRSPIVSDHRLTLPSSMHWPIETKDQSARSCIQSSVHVTAVVNGGPGPLCDEPQISIQARPFSLVAVQGNVFVDQAPCVAGVFGGHLGGLAVQYCCSRGLSRGSSARLGPLLDPH
jgi:hypothetical protein